MSEQIIIHIARPEVRIEYRAESKEAELTDRLAASELDNMRYAHRTQDESWALVLVGDTGL